MKRNTIREQDSMKTIQTSDLLKYNLDFFTHMSSQRMQMFNYYITIIVILIGGFITMVIAGWGNRFYESIDLLMIFFISMAFIGIDIRTKEGVTAAANALFYIERIFPDPDMGIMHQAEKDKHHKLISYSFIIRSLYTCIGLSAVVIVILLNLGYIIL